MTLWSPVREEALVVLAASGLSAAQIAIELGDGVSRNMVIGKLRRAGVALKNARGNPTREEREKRRAVMGERRHAKRTRIYFERFAGLPVPKIPIPEPLFVNLLDLKQSHCRYPLDDRGDNGLMLFCGNPRYCDSSYCPAHHQMTVRA